MPRKLVIPRSAAKDRASPKIAQPPLAASTLRLRRSTRIEVRDLLKDFPSSSKTLSQFAVQLLLDPGIAAVNFIKRLPFLALEVPINMLVVDLQPDRDERVAFDLVNERPVSDIDHEGLLQLSLHHHRIRLVEIDQTDIDTEPRAGNCKLIWSHRDHVVPISLESDINHALTAHRALTVRSLGTMIGVRDPIVEVATLICQGILLTDLSVALGPASILHRASNAWPSPTRFGHTSKRLGKAASRWTTLGKGD